LVFGFRMTIIIRHFQPPRHATKRPPANSCYLPPAGRYIFTITCRGTV
jgi:hypothetical protein